MIESSDSKSVACIRSSPFRSPTDLRTVSADVRRINPGLGFLPAPDDVVNCWNTFFQQEENGTWRGWVVPLGEAKESSSAFLVRGPDATSTRKSLGAAIVVRMGEIEEEEGEEAAQRFQALHSVKRLKKDIPPIDWPPPNGFHETLWFVPEEEKRERAESARGDS